METYPLASLSLEEGMALQFRLVDRISAYFPGREILTQGDLGLNGEYNRPATTVKTEQVLADFFDSEAALLVRGAGTGAIRWGLGEISGSGQKLLVHQAPIYPTTRVTIEQMGIQAVEVDFHDGNKLKQMLADEQITGALVQYTRQKPDDRYDIEEVMGLIRRERPDVGILTDDNYAVMKVKKIGVQAGADLSAFSLFKLLGPEGVGCLVGRKQYLDQIRQKNYSGGCQVQGHEALAALRGLVYAPVALAIQAMVVEECCRRLNQGEIAGVANAYIANAQSKILLVELDRPVAEAVLAAAEKLGAAPHPVGAESKYELVPMFYRVSGTFRAADAQLGERMIRINPMRAGADTVLKILAAALAGL